MWYAKVWSWLEQHPGEIIGTFIMGGSVAAILEAISELTSQGLQLWVRIPVPILMASFIGYVVNRLKNIQTSIKAEEMKFVRNEERAVKHLRQWIYENRPGKADLLEYAAVTIHNSVLVPLIENKAQIRLLIQNPESAIGETQRRRICDQITSILSFEPEIAKYQEFRIKCYSQLASLRGRNFSNELVNVGWLTYDVRPDLLDREREPIQVWGHNNPLITIFKQDDNFIIVQEFFNNIFSNLWQDGEYLNVICERCRKECSVKGSRWVNQVSQDTL